MHSFLIYYSQTISEQAISRTKRIDKSSLLNRKDSFKSRLMHEEACSDMFLYRSLTFKIKKQGIPTMQMTNWKTI